MNDRFFHLLSRHQKLDEALHAERSRSLPDPFRLQQLGRMRQRIKNRLARMMGGGRVLQLS